ncbi:MAG: hypothetical protein ACD_28C00378G0002 [uncultured bacterium]|nr:MAG: hypothetical protein ACD_28C00378G0002 [uncultured bacterium]KKT74010.1 MAG: hypothetical protein UW70_C0069G0004 [Candidatus Peregrinibacteria bacterium GW2011_GWA2_44_7]
METLSVNYFAILVAGLSAMVTGFLWYGPLFGKWWIELMGWPKEEVQKMQKEGSATMGKNYSITFVMALLTAFVIAHFAQAIGAEGVQGAFQLAFWLWFGFIITSMMNSVLWEGKSWKLYGLNISYELVKMFVMALILIFWP